jgi:hypothetical protein
MSFEIHGSNAQRGVVSGGVSSIAGSGSGWTVHAVPLEDDEPVELDVPLP